MKKQILITLCSMEVGGIERSAAGLINSIDHDKYDIDLLLFSKKGEFISLLPNCCNVLPEIPACATLLKSVKETLLSAHPLMAGARLVSKIKCGQKYRNTDFSQDALVFANLQSIWDESLKFMPLLKKEYDIAFSFMWPHHFVAEKVHAKIKLAWIHTDYTKAALDKRADEKIWNKFDTIVAVSDECANAFKSVYPALSRKLITCENVLSSEFVRSQAKEFEPEEMAGTHIKILTVGRFCYAKAFDVAVDICKILVDFGLNIKWYALGYGTLEQEVRDKVKKLSLEDNFIFLGKKTNPYPYINACDIYVQPSRYEGKAVTVREAQMLGKPIVITDFTTAGGQVKKGIDAFVSPMAPEAVAADIKKLIEDDRTRNELIKNTMNFDYSNMQEVEKLFKFIEAGE